MLSRVAETVYWAARQIERAENTARLVEANSHLIYDMPRRFFRGWEPILRITGAEERFHSLYKTASEPNVVRFLLVDPRNSSSALSCLEQARANLRTVRDIFPRAAWEQLNRFYLQTKHAASPSLSRTGQQLFTEGVKTGCQQHVGVLTGTLSRNDAMNFILLGRRLERADMVSRILDAQSESLDDGERPPFHTALWRATLHSVSGYQMYRQTVGSAVDGPAVLRFLLRDLAFPRSVLRCVAALEGPLKRLPRRDATLRLVRRTGARVKGMRTAGVTGKRLSEQMDGLQIEFSAIHRKLEETYFLTGARA
jgi:uncharacterized alpha-E superfamily protein